MRACPSSACYAVRMLRALKSHFTQHRTIQTVPGNQKSLQGWDGSILTETGGAIFDSRRLGEGAGE